MKLPNEWKEHAEYGRTIREKEHGSLKTLWSYPLSFALADLWIFFNRRNQRYSGYCCCHTQPSLILTDTTYPSDSPTPSQCAILLVNSTRPIVLTLPTANAFVQLCTRH